MDKLLTQWQSLAPGYSHMKPAHVDVEHCKPGQKQAGHIPDHHLSHLVKAFLKNVFTLFVFILFL